MTTGRLFSATLFAFGIYWMRQMAARWRADLETWRTTRDSSERTSLVIVWGVTGVIAFQMIAFVASILLAILRAVPS